MSLVQRGPKGIYHAVLYIKGKQVWRSLKTANEKQASILYGKLLEKQDTVSDGAIKPILWDEFMDRYEKEYCHAEKRQSTISRDRIILKAFARDFGVTKSTDLSPRLFERFKNARKGDVEDRTINRQLGVLLNMAKWGQKEMYIDKVLDFHSVRLLPPTKKLRTFFELSAVSVLKKAFKSCTLKQRLIVQAGLFTGMRSGELLEMKASWLDFENNIINIKATDDWRPKDAEEREIPLYPEPAKTLKEWIKARGLGPDDYVMIHENGERIGNSGYLRRTLLKVMRGAGMGQKACYRTLRHTFATHAGKKLDSETLRSIMGHADIKTTQIYRHTTRDAVKEAALKPLY